MNYIEQLMKYNGIEVNEEFYIFYGNHRLGNQTETRYFFNEKLCLEEKVDDFHTACNTVLRYLMTGEYRIEKIPHKPKTVWDLKEKDEYYYIDIYGNVDITTFGIGTCWEDKKMIEIGNAFLTEEEAKHEVEQIKCEAVLLKYGTRDMMSLGDGNKSKYCIYLNNFLNKIIVSDNYCVQSQGTIYFESKELAQKAIDECGEDRLKKYVFNVKE